MNEVPHEYGPSTVGHGEAQCKWCHGTNRENAIISPNHCEERAKSFRTSKKESRPQPSPSKSYIEYLRELAKWAGVEWHGHSMHNTAEAAILKAADYAEELDRRAAAETRDELPTAELYNRVGQLLAGWKQGCAPGEWSDFDESVLQAWQSWRVMQTRRHQNDLPSACGERFGNGAHHECCREPNHLGKCRCSCGADSSEKTNSPQSENCQHGIPRRFCTALHSRVHQNCGSCTCAEPT